MVIITADIVLAAALRCKGCPLIKIDIAGPGSKGLFSIDAPQALLDSYDLGQLLVEPTKFNTEIKSLTTAVRRKNGYNSF
jgi:hypothetical protein